MEFEKSLSYFTKKDGAQFGEVENKLFKESHKRIYKLASVKQVENLYDIEDRGFLMGNIYHYIYFYNIQVLVIIALIQDNILNKKSQTVIEYINFVYELLTPENKSIVDKMIE